jgi:hypothetical protein
MCLRADLAAARQSQNYWKAEHNAANSEIDKLKADLAAARELLIRVQRAPPSRARQEQGMKEEMFWKIRRGLVIFAKWLVITFAFWLFAAIALICIAGASHFLGSVFGLQDGVGMLIVLSLVVSGVTALFFCQD